MTAGCWQNSQAHFGCHPSLEGLRADVDTAPINEAYLIRCDNQFDAFLIVTALVFIDIDTGGKLKYHPDRQGHTCGGYSGQRRELFLLDTPRAKFKIPLIEAPPLFFRTQNSPIKLQLLRARIFALPNNKFAV